MIRFQKLNLKKMNEVTQLLILGDHTILRDHTHNTSVMKEGRERFLKRRHTMTFNDKDLGTCPLCLQEMLKNTISVHQGRVG